MTELRSQLEERAAARLREAGFDTVAPDPRAAWRAFKAFALDPVPAAVTVTAGYETYQAADRDRVVWLSFVRNIETADGTGWHVGYVFSRVAPEALVGAHDQTGGAGTDDAGAVALGGRIE